MKTKSQSSCRGSSQAAFSYIELLVASGVLLFISLALVSSNVSGARISQIVTQQYDGMQLARRVSLQIKKEVQEADIITVGPGDFGDVTSITNGIQQGSALKLIYQMGGGVSKTVIYYVHGGALKRCVNAVASGIEVVVPDLVTSEPFMVVDPLSVASSGGVSAVGATNIQGQALLRVWLELSTVGGQSKTVGPGTSFQDNVVTFFATQRGG